MGYQHIEVEVEDGVATLWLNRPDKLNALSEDMWADIPAAMSDLDDDDDVRVIILGGRGAAFTVGIDVNMLAGLRPDTSSVAMTNKQVYRDVKRLQKTVSSFADTAKPVIAAIHGYCLGAGANIISACDIRLGSEDALISIRETKMGLVADVGALQRLPAIVGVGTTAEMAMTGNDYTADWCRRRGLLSDVYPDRESLHEGAQDMARAIAVNSPLVTQGIKRILQANVGQTMEQALDYMAQWNASFLLSNDLNEAMAAFIEKREPDYTGT